MGPLDKPDYVSIILCHYSQRGGLAEESNIRKGFIRKCISSIENNTDFPAEIIVVDNGGKNDDSNYLLDKVRQGTINNYLRNKDNMFYGWAWNQGVKLATSDFIVFMTNDVVVKKNWLSTSLLPFYSYDDKFVVAITGSKEKYDRPYNDRYHINKWAGSDCMMMTKEIFYDIGEFTTHHLAGSMWQQKMHALKYKVLVPTPPKAGSLGARKGFILKSKNKIEVKKKLLNSYVADFTDPYKSARLIR